VDGKGAAAGLKIDPRLQGTIDKIAQDPEGAKLLEAAKANGLKSITVNPNLPGGTAGVTKGFGDGTQSIEIKDPNSADAILVMAHELGHAATPGDGDSQTEEKVVTEVGRRIQQRVTGQGSGFTLNEGAYGNLPLDNGIRDSLRRIGIAA